MDTLYLEHILEHYKNPRNKGVLATATFSRRSNNPSCGDDITLQARIDNGRVTDAAFDGVGCAISTASASLLTEYIKGKTVDDLRCIGAQDVLDLLGVDVNEARMKCAMLPLKALEKGLSLC